MRAIVSKQPEYLSDVDACADRVVAHASASELRLAAPLALGKPNVLLNAIYARAVRDPSLKLTLFTALSLARPQPRADLERRFLGPFLERQFGSDYPDLDYVTALHAGTLPANVAVHEFYLQSGAMLGVPAIQRNYTSINYTHVARDMAHMGVNAFVQMVAVRDGPDGRRYSLACNPDVTRDLFDQLAAVDGPRAFGVAVVNPQLPFVGNDAEIEPGFFDVILDAPSCHHALFALPREPVDVSEHALGLHASTLVRDGGTLQIGIGTLSDALVSALVLRHRDNAAYREALRALTPAADPERASTAGIGALDPFERGLYGASEMVMDGFMHLARAGILSRRIYDDFGIETALAHGRIGEVLGADAGDALHAAGVLPDCVGHKTVHKLVHFGLLPPNAAVQDGVVTGLSEPLPVQLHDAPARAAWNRALAGRRLRNGRYLRGAFFLGSKDFYAWLRGLDGDDFEGFSMTRVSDINQLYGGSEQLDALQRRGARFFNICMMATALGAAVSDGLADGQVVSGVGGQYNFVAMAHALRDGRSILMFRSTREHRGRASSNVLWNYGHTTIPRHLRDIYVTEYGIADLRGRSDEDCIVAMLSIADARFQDDIAAQAKAAGKLRADFAIPDAWRRNTRAHLAAALAPMRARGLFSAFPFGSDFTPDELALLPALKLLRGVSQSPLRLGAFLAASLLPGPTPPGAAAALARLGLARPRRLGDRLLASAVVRALRLAPSL